MMFLIIWRECICTCCTTVHPPLQLFGFEAWEQKGMRVSEPIQCHTIGNYQMEKSPAIKSLFLLALCFRSAMVGMQAAAFKVMYKIGITTWQGIWCYFWQAPYKQLSKQTTRRYIRGGIPTSTTCILDAFLIHVDLSIWTLRYRTSIV